jgi:hypothetical protein
MTIWWLVLVLAALGSVGIAFIWLAVHVGSGKPKSKDAPNSYEDAAEQDVEHILTKISAKNSAIAGDFISKKSLVKTPCSCNRI